MDLNFFKRDYNFFKVFSIFSIFVIIFLKKFNYIDIEAIDFDVLQRIINPDISKGAINYDPHYNFNYLVFYLYKILGENLTLSLQIIWFISELIVLISFKKIIKKFFLNNFLTFFLVFLLYISFRSGEIDQKTIAYPFVYLSIYYFFSKKYYKGFFILSTIFYLHIGLAIWTSIPLCFVFLIHNYNNLLELIKKYLFFLLLISPITYFYFQNIFLSKINYDEELFFFYWKGNISNSLYTYFLNANHALKFFIFGFLILIFFHQFTIFNSLKKNIQLFLFGILITFILNFILCDILNINYALKLQLLRVDYFLFFFAMLISCSFASLEAKKERYVPLLIYVILVIPNIIHLKYGTLYYREFFFLSILICLLMSKNNQYLKLNFYLNLIINKLIKIDYKKIYIYIFLIFIIQKSFSLTSINEKIKNKVVDKNIINIFQKNSNFHSETVKFINKNFDNNKNIIFLIPFYEIDMRYFINYKVLFSPSTLSDYYIDQTIVDVFSEILIKDLEINKKDIFHINWKKIWGNISGLEIERWRADYGLTHLVSENDKIFNYKIVYRNDLYTIYDLTNKRN